jgi:hypothetical protein
VHDLLEDSSIELFVFPGRSPSGRTLMLAPEKSLRRVVRKVVVLASAVVAPQAAPEALPVVPPEEENYTSQGAEGCHGRAICPATAFASLALQHLAPHHRQSC